MPKMNELISWLSRRIAAGKKTTKLSGNTKNTWIFSVTGGQCTCYYRLLKDFYDFADIPIIFHEKIDETLGYKHQAWLGIKLLVTKWTKEAHKID